MQEQRAEAHQIFGGGEESSAGPFVAVVHIRRVFLMAVLGQFIKPGTLLNDLRVLVRGRMDQAHGGDYVILHVGQKGFARSGFNHRAEEIESVAGVIELGSGRRDERIIFEYF